MALTTWQDDDSCTADASPSLSRVRLPGGVDPGSLIEVRITFGTSSETAMATG